MQYIQANKIFPEYLLTEIQKYADGCIVYIPNKRGNRKEWGIKTNTKTEISERNENIRNEYRNGKSLKELNDKYYLYYRHDKEDYIFKITYLKFRYTLFAKAN